MLGTEHQDALQTIAALRNRKPEIRIVERTVPVIVQSSEENRSSAELQSEGIGSWVSKTAMRRTSDPVMPKASRGTDLAAAEPILPSSSLSSIDGANDYIPGRWQAGLRDNFRLSLPRVYGLPEYKRSILFDKEVTVGL